MKSYSAKIDRHTLRGGCYSSEGVKPGTEYLTWSDKEGCLVVKPYGQMVKSWAKEQRIILGDNYAIEAIIQNRR